MARSTRTRLVGLVVAGVLCGAIVSTLSAQQAAQPAGQRGGQRGGGERGAQPAATPAPQETTPALMFKEQWQQAPSASGTPTSPRRSANQYFLASQTAVANPNLELKLYGADAKNLTVYLHEGRYDLWTGLVGSPIAVLLKHKNNFMDLTGLARVRATLRTGNLHSLHPAVRLATGALLAGTQVIDTEGEFLQIEVAFANQRWYTIEADTLAVKGLAMMPDLARVDEVGFVDLAQAGGHGSSGWANISTIEVYAKPASR